MIVSPSLVTKQNSTSDLAAMASDSISTFLSVVSVQFMLLWSIGSSQKPGFTSIDCGSSYRSTYTDYEGIEWVSDSNLTSEGTSIRLSDNVLNQVLVTMRVFNGSQNKYCYSITNSMNSYIVPKAFFLVRASIKAGANPPFTPRNNDGMFRLKMIVDADEWQDVEIPYQDTRWWTYDMYTRAQRNSIDVCFARDGPDGDAPFVSGLELRPLPDTLSTTLLMNGTGRIFICMGHSSYGVLSSENLTSVDVVESIKSILGLSNYTGDPCLPAGYGYNWLNCSKDNPGIAAIILSNYQTGGKIPTELNQLTTLTDIYLDGNNLTSLISVILKASWFLISQTTSSVVPSLAPWRH
ncbi:hypothetical protein KP509_1Z082700 [Ceratopteris richardii]|nr:hypothetical protein KP509_1Z082700 [Ceratopteris richardii]